MVQHTDEAPRLISPDDVAEMFLFIHNQPRRYTHMGCVYGLQCLFDFHVLAHVLVSSLSVSFLADQCYEIGDEPETSTADKIDASDRYHFACWITDTQRWFKHVEIQLETNRHSIMVLRIVSRCVWFGEKCSAWTFEVDLRPWCEKW